MKISVLVENTTVSSDLQAKHGLSLYIESRDKRIVFDVGPANIIIGNADRMGVDLANLDYVVISHGHNDHGGALKSIVDINSDTPIYLSDMAFDEHYARVLLAKMDIGLDKNLVGLPQIKQVSKSTKIDEGAWLVTKVINKDFHPRSNAMLVAKTGKKYPKDDFAHEVSLVLEEYGKYFLLAGCAHAGLHNIVRAAEDFCGVKMDFVFSGMHLTNPISKSRESDDFISIVALKLMTTQAKYYTGHCTGADAYNKLKETLGERVQTISTGETIIL